MSDDVIWCEDCEQPDRWHCLVIQKKIEGFYAERRQRRASDVR